VPIPLWLHHMNPMFVDRPPFFVQLTPAQTLMVPVAKDGQLPPGLKRRLACVSWSN
jgi:hypothetical protein